MQAFDTRHAHLLKIQKLKKTHCLVQGRVSVQGTEEQFFYPLIKMRSFTESTAWNSETMWASSLCLCFVPGKFQLIIQKNEEIRNFKGDLRQKSNPSIP